MDNDPIKSGGEEEFSFVEDQEAPKFEPASDKKSGMSSSGGGRRKIIIIIVIIIALFFLYKLYGLFSTTSVKTPTPSPTTVEQPSKPEAQTPTSTVPAIETPAQQEESQPAEQETVPEAVQQADKDIKAIESEESTKETTSQNIEVIDNKMAELEQAITENGQADENLQQQIGGLTSAISGIQDNISALTQQINSLSDQLKPKKVQPAPVVTKKPKKIIKSYKPKAPKYVYVPSSGGGAMPAGSTYFVKALIQGRAWLITPDGATFTISSGDNLPGYGQVLSIDPNKGLVMTSSGRVIGFMPQDR